MMVTDKDRILLSDDWVPCRICLDVFRRQRMTLRYCDSCENGFCEGEHGSFAYGLGKCVICGAHKNYKTKQRSTAVA